LPGYTPTQIKNYYGLNQVTFNGTAADGTGQTIAIVENWEMTPHFDRT